MRTGSVMSVIVCALFLSVTCMAEEGSSLHKTFPTKEEIELVVTQAERVFDQYRQSIEVETELPSAKKEKSALEKDRQIAELSKELIDALKKKPESFNGLMGLLLLTTLDDASRN